MLQEFLNKLTQQPETVEFADTMAVIDNNYTFTETRFLNGDQVNEAGTNSGSCKILAFGQLNGLSVAATLACFGHYYRDEVLKDPEGSSHQNIRQLMVKGWEGVVFEGQALKAID